MVTQSISETIVSLIIGGYFLIGGAIWLVPNRGVLHRRLIATVGMWMTSASVFMPSIDEFNISTIHIVLRWSGVLLFLVYGSKTIRDSAKSQGLSES